MATFEEFYNSLPKDRYKRGKVFEEIFIPWFLRTAPEWSSKINKIWPWKKYPHRWGQDCGIDLFYGTLKESTGPFRASVFLLIVRSPKQESIVS